MINSSKTQNPRYTAFINIGGVYNWDYMNFIGQMKTLYANSKGMINTPVNPAPIFDKDDFTDFIKINASLYEATK